MNKNMYKAGLYIGNIYNTNESDSELELAQVQEASRIQRSIPSIRSASQPYQCQVMEPKLELGYQWPSLSRQTGFLKLTPQMSIRIQRQVDQWLLSTKRQKKNRRLIDSSTTYLKETYNTINPEFLYNQTSRPKRVLTKPSKPIHNEGFDNENFDYILKVNEILGHDPNYQYRIIDLLGQGTFGQVVKCEHTSTGELYSVKLDPDDKHHILRLHHVFSHKQHLCLVFELLSYNLYDLIGHNQYRGFPIEKVRAFAVQILDTLSLLKEAKIIHCDLKPENILLANEKSLSIKVIDFGSSCHEANRIYTYIQSRFYRSPEVILGMRYTNAIDMWSFGCIVAELYLGLPLFPGSSEYNQLFRIVEMLGIPSRDMLSKGRNTNIYFTKRKLGHEFEYELKSREQYSLENNKNELPRKQYFPYTNLKDLILQFNGRGATATKRPMLSPDEYQARLCLLDFLSGVLELNPLKRWTPQQATQHPFITQKPFNGSFKPDIPIATTTNNKKLTPITRRRAESMGTITAPEQIQALANQIIQSPLPTKQYMQQPQHIYRQRNTRSQGDDLGLLAPQQQKKKVVIAPEVNIRDENRSSKAHTTNNLFMMRPNPDTKRSYMTLFKRRGV
ncbi:kinase-like domain-containing protein [Cokeromyces recurvatus]|uniref:kinase-like domain-containing protein n=1 Tax=Cokeromyces recurvatus TaxID=90255 RepID=UPI0022201E99|nr:kinase-like domain-containing protein [Cokeromyces recurvatus]KAI7906250.1 kinase-like domain-containing protein [Cokeromyces recurvatus]